MPGEVTADHGREAAYRQRLGHAGHAFEQDVALGQQADHELFDHVLLADDDPLHLGDGVAEQLRGLLVAQLARGRRWPGPGWWGRRTPDCSHNLLLLVLQVLLESARDEKASLPAARQTPVILADPKAQRRSLDKRLHRFRRPPQFRTLRRFLALDSRYFRRAARGSNAAFETARGAGRV